MVKSHPETIEIYIKYLYMDAETIATKKSRLNKQQETAITYSFMNILLYANELRLAYIISHNYQFNMKLFLT